MSYANFKTAIYCTVFDIETADWDHLQEEYRFIEKNIQVDKVYLETYRSEKFVSGEKMKAAITFFQKKNIACSGGITFSAKGKTTWDFKSFCYSRKKYVDELVKVIEYTAGLFDEVILDDFYFTNCKCDSCIAEKGSKSWDIYRTEKLKEMSELMVRRAKKVNPNSTIIIKYPNWYEDYQFTGYNPRDQREIHGAIYTGTETRDPALTQQNLPRYLSYFLMRYLENAYPGKNGGGWFDPFDCTYNLNSYLEQAYLTLYAKARETTLFCLGALLRHYPQFVPLAGFVFENFDRFAGKLGNPRGIACYKPFHSSGENYMLPAFGMMGIPLEPTPFFPENAETLILSESASDDPELLSKVKTMLKKGKTVLMTSGLASRIQNKGLKDLIDIEIGGVFPAERIATDMLMCGFRHYSRLEKPILFQKICHRTNDSWAIVSAQGTENGNPVFIETAYSEGTLLILNVPERFTDLYQLPVEALDSIRKKLTGELSVRISAPSGIGLFVYDNHTFIVESFLQQSTPVQVTVKGSNKVVRLDREETIKGSEQEGNFVFTIDLSASCFQAFQAE